MVPAAPEWKQESSSFDFTNSWSIDWVQLGIVPVVAALGDEPHFS